jgi:hypothetical protein
VRRGDGDLLSELFLRQLTRQPQFAYALADGAGYPLRVLATLHAAERPSQRTASTLQHMLCFVRGGAPLVGDSCPSSAAHGWLLLQLWSGQL